MTCPRRACQYEFCYECLRPQHTHGVCSQSVDLDALMRDARSAGEDAAAAVDAVEGLAFHEPEGELKVGRGRRGCFKWAGGPCCGAGGALEEVKVRTRGGRPLPLFAGVFKGARSRGNWSPYMACGGFHGETAPGGINLAP